MQRITVSPSAAADAAMQVAIVYLRLAAAYDSEHLRQLQRDRGICSMPDCPLPIAGWCSTCDARGPFVAPKVCQQHLDAHRQRHAGHVPFYPYAHREGGASA